MNKKNIVAGTAGVAVIVTILVLPQLLAQPDPTSDTPTHERDGAAIGQVHTTPVRASSRRTQSYQVKEVDTVADIAILFGLDETVIQSVAEQTGQTALRKGTWLLWVDGRYLVVADAAADSSQVFDVSAPHTPQLVSVVESHVRDALVMLKQRLTQPVATISHNHQGHHHDHDHHGHHHDHDHHGHHHDHNHHGHHHDHDHHGHYHDHNHHGHHHDHDHHGHHHDYNHHGHHHDHNHHAHTPFVFNPRDIVSEDNEGYFVKHGDHLHYVYKKDVAHLMPKNETPMVPKPTNPTKVDDKKAAEIAAKVDYIVTVYGVPKEAIKVRDEYFVFNDPSHAYDPTHIHPYVIAIDKLRIPERSEDPEIDFENELFAVAEHTGISPYKLVVKNGQFVIPHTGHSHYLRVQSSGAELFYKNRLPEIKGRRISGEVDTNRVLHQVEELAQLAERQFANNPKQLRRIHFALGQFKENLLDLSANSTEGYLAALDQFHKEQFVGDGNGSADAPQDTMWTERYNETVTAIRALKLRGFSITREDLLSELQLLIELKEERAFASFTRKLNTLKKADVNVMPETVKALDYLMKNWTKPQLSDTLRDLVAEYIQLTYRVASFKERVPFGHLVPQLIDVREQVRQAVETEAPTGVVNTDSEVIARFSEPTKDPTRPYLTYLQEIGLWVDSLRDTVINNFLDETEKKEPGVLDELIGHYIPEVIIPEETGQVDSPTNGRASETAELSVNVPAQERSVEQQSKQEKTQLTEQSPDQPSSQASVNPVEAATDSSESPSTTSDPNQAEVDRDTEDF